MSIQAYKDEAELKRKFDITKTPKQFKLNDHLYEFQTTDIANGGSVKFYHSKEERHTLHLHIREGKLFHISGVYKIPD